MEKVRTKEFKEDGAKQVIKFFENDFEKYEWINIKTDIINLAKELIKKHGTNTISSPK